MVNTALTTHLFLSEDDARKQWLEERKHSIGSSDAAAVLGVHPYWPCSDVHLSRSQKDS